MNADRRSAPADPLARLDESQRAQLASARSQLAEAQAQLTLANQTLKRQKELAARQLVAASSLDAVCGVILSANLRQFTPLAGQSYLMDAIAAVFIGTAFNRLGRVSILGTLGGVLFLAIIDNGLNLMGLNYLVKDALVGVILVVALALSFWQARLRQTHR